ncbi:phospholipase D-like domain-containing protein [Vreelandella rituensis]|uniref:Cardiolipin synthase B n=1 Tax=Vreelandella rituensis TaxID=2282306 RepID=A0A368TS98_9GAMM|nr:phospholipase D-like domain-containing protein [Halomonas rituensis]RCV86083.1 cardiolipin synthase B [Halomonas rituensis]
MPDQSPDYRLELEYALGTPFTEGNRVDVLRNGVEIFPAMLEAIHTARETIEMVTFVYWTGDIARKFAQALADRAREGVVVRVVLDSIGAKKMSQEFVKLMEEAGVDIRWFRPFNLLRPWHIDKRTHRKILICDGKVGFTGGVGIAKEWEGDARNENEWRETHLRVYGPAVIGLYSAFLDNWNERGEWQWRPIHHRAQEHEKGIPIQFLRASSTIGWTETAAILRSLVSISQVRLRIVTAYFVPDSVLVDAMITAVKRGVEVEVLVPGAHNDSRLSQLAGQPSIELLLDAGVKIWAFQPTVLHAKIVTVDGQLSNVGSVNVNRRSMGKDEECSAMLLCKDVTARLDADFEDDCKRATPLSSEQFKRRSGWVRLKERAARLIVEQL